MLGVHTEYSKHSATCAFPMSHPDCSYVTVEGIKHASKLDRVGHAIFAATWHLQTVGQLASPSTPVCTKSPTCNPAYSIIHRLCILNNETKHWTRTLHVSKILNYWCQIWVEGCSCHHPACIVMCVL